MKKILLLTEIAFVFLLISLLNQLYDASDTLKYIFGRYRYAEIFNLILCFVIIMPLLKKYLWQWQLLDFGFRKRKHKASFKYTLMLLSIGFLLSSVLIFMPDLARQSWKTYGLKSWNDVLFGIFVISIFNAGILEELQYRAFLQGGLQSVVGKGWGIFLSALYFAYMHSHAGLFLLFTGYIPVAFFISCVYFKTRYLLVLISWHILNDMIGFFGLGLMNLCAESIAYLPYLLIPSGIALFIYTKKEFVIIIKLMISVLKSLKKNFVFNLLISLPVLYFINRINHYNIKLNLTIHAILTIILFLSLFAIKYQLKMNKK